MQSNPVPAQMASTQQSASMPPRVEGCGEHEHDDNVNADANDDANDINDDDDTNDDDDADNDDDDDE